MPSIFWMDYLTVTESAFSFEFSAMEPPVYKLLLFCACLGLFPFRGFRKDLRFSKLGFLWSLLTILPLISFRALHPNLGDLQLVSPFLLINLLFLVFRRRQVERGFELINSAYRAGSRRYSIFKMLRPMYLQVDSVLIAVTAGNFVWNCFSSRLALRCAARLAMKLLVRMIGLQFSVAIKIASLCLRDMRSELKQTSQSSIALKAYTKRYWKLTLGCQELNLSYRCYILFVTVVLATANLAEVVSEVQTGNWSWAQDDRMIRTLVNFVYSFLLPWQIIDTCEKVSDEVKFTSVFSKENWR
ncbi:Hypothetical protein NTJ_13261 [Nesidiocoris tenuis]|uniref:Uncharacterized protein n=1 Tax=Nesidiocoris tenuis TaxID=355587 RepID=A0ABN7B839_9HEMI|nr:Hypothetical protein NTJ_13261 [Nesidiocoris tenuis]